MILLSSIPYSCKFHICQLQGQYYYEEYIYKKLTWNKKLLIIRSFITEKIL